MNSAQHTAGLPSKQRDEPCKADGGKRRKESFKIHRKSGWRLFSVHHIRSASLIWSEVESCFRIGNQRQKEPSCAERHGLSGGRKQRRQRSPSAGQPPGTVPTRQHQDQTPCVWLTPAPESEGVTPCVTPAALKSLSGSEEDSLLQGAVLRKLPLEREKAMRGHGADREWARRQCCPQCQI